MLHPKQWHYSLHRDFQNCYSTRRSPTGFFSSNSTRVPIHHPHTTYKLHTHAHYREFSIQNPIPHAEDKELFEYYYYIQRAKRPSFQKRNSMHRRQGDLLEINPCVLQDLLKAFQTFQSFQSFQTFQSFMTFQPFQAILQVPVPPGFTPHYSILQLECIFYIFYKFYSSIGFHRKLHRVPVGQLQTLQTFIHSSKKGRCCDIGQIDIFFRIELFPLSSLSSDNTNCKNDIPLFHQLFDELSVYRDYH